ncbi:MAG: ABC transporter permease [Actinobacteria bacterium]|nr:ABC transporter permease [Actinomycetota bacterium]
MDLATEVLAGGVRGGTSILFAGLGETISERAGVVNLGTEGNLLVGALAGYAVASTTGSPWAGVIAGAVAGGMLSAIHAYFVLDRKTNQLATGLVVLFLALGLTSMFGVAYIKATINPFEALTIPGLSSIPFLGPVLFDQTILTYLVYVLVPATWWLLFRSRWGVVLRAAGERSNVLATYGHHVLPVQYLAVIGGGMLAGIGGAQLSTAYTNAWYENMTQGRGFIAVAVVIFAGREPFKVAAGSLLFGAALALAPALQARGIGINQFALDVVPYVLTIVVLVVFGKRMAAQQPEGLKKVFEGAPAG